jgi:acetyl esterase
MPLHPQAAALLAQMRDAGARPFEELTVREAREAAAAFKDLEGPPEAGVSVAHRFITGPTADLPIAIYTPPGEGPFPALLYLHGSGWVILNIDVVDIPLRALANRTGCVMIAVNYQKAPEHKFPTAFDDCYAALQWVVANAEELGIDPARVGVGGDSAGGNLAAALAIHARDSGPALRYQLLVYPVTDHSFDTPSYLDNAEGYLLQRATMQWFWNHHLRTAADGDDWRASPLRAADLSGLPPAFVVTAEFDVLRDEGEAYAERLRAAGVDVTLRRYDGMIHGFLFMAGVLDDARVLIDDIAASIRTTLTVSSDRQSAR